MSGWALYSFPLLKYTYNFSNNFSRPELYGKQDTHNLHIGMSYKYLKFNFSKIELCFLNLTLYLPLSPCSSGQQMASLCILLCRPNAWILKMGEEEELSRMNANQYRLSILSTKYISFIWSFSISLFCTLLIWPLQGLSY